MVVACLFYPQQFHSIQQYLDNWLDKHRYVVSSYRVQCRDDCYEFSFPLPSALSSFVSFATKMHLLLASDKDISYDTNMDKLERCFV